MRRRPSSWAIAAILALVTQIAGCGSNAPAQVTSAWPVADSERVIERPADLVRWPLTGELAPNEESIAVRVASIKIENSAASRPQSNLDMADVVYETLTEGGITRFNALYHSKAPEVVGPVRSARLSDIHIVPQYNAIFAHVGGNTGVMNRIRSSGMDDMDQFFNPGPYWRSSDRPRPHNMYVSVPKLRQASIARGHEASQTLTGFSFDLMADESTPTIVQVTVPFAPGNSATWDYDAGLRAYARSINGRAHADRISNRQYTANNVVVVWARTAATAKTDVTGSQTLDIELSGSGRVSVFRDGQRYDGNWQAGSSTPPKFVADDGQLIRLAPGNTWVQVIPANVSITMR